MNTKELELMDLKFYTPEETAEMLKIPISTIRKHLRDGDLQGHKVGRVWRIEHKQLLEYIGEPKRGKEND